MPTIEINLEVVGLCVVAEWDNVHHTVIAVEPPEKNIPPLPPLDVYLIFSQDASRQNRGSRLPLPREVEAESYSRIEEGMERIKIPPRTTVTLSNPTKALPKLDELDPASLEDLGLGKLKNGVGRGAWHPGEAARFQLPQTDANSGWGVYLGSYKFPKTGEEKDVADLYFWRAAFDAPCQFDFHDERNQKLGTLTLQKSTKVLIACYPNTEPEQGSPFDFSTALARLCTDGPTQPPDRTNPIAAHIGSGSCPPIKGP